MTFKNWTRLFAISILTGFITLLNSCSSYIPQNAEVRIHALSDPDMLNPINYSDANAGYILTNIFPSLLAIDFKTSELVPVIAIHRPTLETMEGGKLKITYQIRPEAMWDNGTPVTAKDVEFTIKVIKNPKVKNENNKPYYEFIEELQIDPKDPKKFSLICNTVYILAETSSGDYGILPEYLYDPKGLMKGFTIAQLNKEKEKLAADEKITAFAEDFNSEKRARDTASIGGCGAYRFKEWKTGERVVLEKKKDWWGDALRDTNCYFEAFTNRLIFQTINDQTSAIVSLKAGNLDVMYGIKPKDYVDLPKSQKVKDNFNLYTPASLQYTYLGINTKLPKFADKHTRQALAHLVDVDKMISAVAYNLATRVVGFVHPTNKKEYNSDLHPYDFNVEKAKHLLDVAGWKDSNGNGTLDKMIDGELVEFTIKFSVNAGNDARKQVALMFQEEARKVGITVDVIAQDWSVYLDNLKAHKFEMYYGAWIATPTPNDPKQIYHSESSNGGSNYTSFGTPESDALIDSIRIQLDETKRAELYKKLQTILYVESPYIYLWAPTEKMAISKKFKNADPCVMRPGFWPAGFKAAQ